MLGRLWKVIKGFFLALVGKVEMQNPEALLGLDPDNPAGVDLSTPDAVEPVLSPEEQALAEMELGPAAEA